MLGAITGDIVGSIYEINNIKTKSFEFLNPDCFFTDDTVLTVALANSILTQRDYGQVMRKYFKRYSGKGYGQSFRQWAHSDNAPAYNSWGNGSAMRTSPVAYAFNTLEEVLENAEYYAAYTHNHIEGIKGAQATASAIFLARMRYSKEEIRSFVSETFNYDLSQSIDEIRPTYTCEISCQGTVPQAITAFLDSIDFEDAIRNAISIGGDSDTIACICGGIAEAFYGKLSKPIHDFTLSKLDDELKEVVIDFYDEFVDVESVSNDITKQFSVNNRNCDSDTLYEHGLGAFLGACVGDASGAPLEMKGRVPTQIEVLQAMDMPGGGVLRVGKGQITDDSELALCLAQALVQDDQFNIENIAKMYVKWFDSEPFDCGYTCGAPMSMKLTEYQLETFDIDLYSENMIRIANYQSMNSKANGSLMRCIPLAIWGHKLDDEVLAGYAIQDSKLSHPNSSCCDAVASYVIAAANLIRTKGDIDLALEKAQRWINLNANEEVKQWFKDAMNNINIPYYPQVGFVKIAYIHAFRHLKLRTPYKQAIEETLLGGGDTDTNACIVGGLLGAAYSAENIPLTMRQAVLSCCTLDKHNSNLNTDYEFQPRPEFLQTNLVEGLTRQLLR